MVSIALGGFLEGAAKAGSQMADEERAEEMRVRERAAKKKNDIALLREKLSIKEELEQNTKKRERDALLDSSRKDAQLGAMIDADASFEDIFRKADELGYPLTTDKYYTMKEQRGKADPAARGRFKGQEKIAEFEALRDFAQGAGVASPKLTMGDGQNITINMAGPGAIEPGKTPRNKMVESVNNSFFILDQLDGIEAKLQGNTGMIQDIATRGSSFLQQVEEAGQLPDSVRSAAGSVGDWLKDPEERIDFKTASSTLTTLGGQIKSMIGESGAMTKADRMRIDEISGGVKVNSADEAIAILNELREISGRVIRNGVPQLQQGDILAPYRDKYSQFIPGSDNKESTEVTDLTGKSPAEMKAAVQALPKGARFRHPKTGKILIKK